MEFRSFAAIRIAVSDLESAVSAWRDQLGWPPGTVSADLVTFPLDGTSVELVQVAAGQRPGVAAIAVTVDDQARTVRHIESAGYRLERATDGSVVVPARDLNGVRLELRQAGAAARRDCLGPFRRVNHVVVAVEDDDAAVRNWARAFGGWPSHAMGGREHFHHVPVGVAWFGLTAAGTDAGALRRFVDRRGEGPYALGLIVDDWARTVARLRRNGARLIADAESNQTFIHPVTTHGVLIEVMAEWHNDRGRPMP
jgi:catechol 2,3-dioxygenase-like lactoylglutathione lyase family enzyme